MVRWSHYDYQMRPMHDVHLIIPALTPLCLLDLDTFKKKITSAFI